MRIQSDDLTGPEIAALLQEHLNDMNAVSPPESKHALDLTGLKAKDIMGFCLIQLIVSGIVISIGLTWL